VLLLFVVPSSIYTASPFGTCAETVKIKQRRVVANGLLPHQLTPEISPLDNAMEDVGLPEMLYGGK
jgi:hypothetical protein